jgi:hypothetical protein
VIWQLLIVTQKSRREMLDQLLTSLHRQMKRMALRKAGEIEILTYHLEPGGLFGIGDARQQLREQATAKYINFIDDDDLVAPDYLSSIFPLLDGRTHYVGFEVAGYHNYVKTKQDFHTLGCGRWFETDQAYWRDISHINPMRRDLAMQAPMSGGIGEDSRWADSIRSQGTVRSQRYIDAVLYHYLYRTPKNDAIDAYHPFRLALLEETTADFASTHPTASVLQ